MHVTAGDNTTVRIHGPQPSLKICTTTPLGIRSTIRAMRDEEFHFLFIHAAMMAAGIAASELVSIIKKKNKTHGVTDQIGHRIARLDVISLQNSFMTTTSSAHTK